MATYVKIKDKNNKTTWINLTQVECITRTEVESDTWVNFCFSNGHARNFNNKYIEGTVLAVKDVQLVEDLFFNATKPAKKVKL